MKLPLIALTLLGCTQLSMAQTATESSEPVRMPPITVTATNTLVEEQPLGANQQPEWTARRRFVTTRVYVQPPWQIEAESGWETVYGRHDKPNHLLTEEVEVGLPGRLQFDYEYAERIDNNVWRYDSSSFELRWALADWGKLPLNPTVKAEWKMNDGAADAYEFSLALAQEITSRLHWALNLFYEQQVGDERETEYSLAQALSYTIIDEKLSIGVEMKVVDENDKADRTANIDVLIGPSIQWRPTPRTHLDIVPLFGVNSRAPHVDSFIFFGIDFGPGSERAEVASPASLRNK